jgi:pimeloyl-ACP methyl ester carboxylesterase
MRFGMLPRKIDIARVAKVAPQGAGDEAFRRFCRPELSHHRSPQQNVLQARARVHLRKARWFRVPSSVGDIPTYEYAPEGEVNGKSVLLVHGWTSEASFMAAFIEPLRQKGFRVVAFDLPAHGHSRRRWANLIDCAHAFHAVATSTGPFDSVVAHSLGGLIALMVADGAAPIVGPARAGRYVLIATPNRLEEFTQDFSHHEGLSETARRSFERHLERIGHRKIETVSAAQYLKVSGRPAMVVHARDDQQVPFSNAEEIVAAHPDAVFHPVDGFGHAGVIFAPPVVRAVRAYLLKSS